MKKVFIIIFLFCYLASNATYKYPVWTLNPFATTYYIATTGDDGTGTGSIGNPWKTLFKATSTVSGTGDIIHVTAGTYTETTQSVLHTGVSIEGEGVTSYIKSTQTTTNDAIITGQSTEGTSGNQHISNIKMDGQLSTSWAIEFRGRSDVSIHDCYIIDFLDRGVYWSGRTDGLELPPSTYATGNTFYNNTVINSSIFSAGFGKGLLTIGGQDGMQIYNNYFNQTGRAPGSNGYCIKYTNDGYIKGCRIYNNTIIKAPFSAIGGDYDFALEIFHGSGLEIDHNRIIGCIDLNYQPKLSYAYSVYIHDNIVGPESIQAQQERGVVSEFDCETILIKNNTFKNLYNPIYYSTRNLSQITDNVITNNLMYGVGVTAGGAGFGVRFISDGSANYTLSNFTVQNNTIVGNFYQGISLVDGAAISGVEINNNIIQGYAHSWLFADPANVITTIAWFKNDFWQAGTWGTSPRYVSGTPSSETSGGNLNVNPLFTGGSDYTLFWNSTLTNAGTNGSNIGYTGIVGAVPSPTFVVVGQPIIYQ